MRQLLVGRAGRGLFASFDPDGPDPTRLRRLDAAAGHVRAAVEGEIFNLEELADELGLPPGSSPEDVVTEGFARWSRELLPRLRGSFALVVAGEREGVIAADQAGGHSIYFHADGRRLAFASELQPLLRLLPSRPAPDPVGVVHLFSDDAAPLGRTLYQGIEELPGGECIELSESGWRRARYWQPRYDPLDSGVSRESAAELLWTALVGSVRRRVRGRVGIVMSGGLDSSAVAAAAVEASRGRGEVESYSVVFPGYPDDRVDECERIDLLGAALGLPGTQVRLEPGGSFALSLEWLRAWDVPLNGPGYLLERPLIELAAAAGVDALLDGQGGDEGFAVSPFWLADLLRAGRLVSSLRMARRLRGGSESWRGLLETWHSNALLGAIPPGLHEALRRRGRPYRHVPAFLTPEKARLHVDTDELWAWKRTSGVPAWWAERAFLLTSDRHAVGVGDYTRRRASLAWLNARPPLLDPDLIECLLRIPPQLGFDPVFDRILMRQALAGRVPDAVRLWTRKSHLGPFFYDVVAGPDLEPIRGVLREPQLRIGEYVKLADVRDLIEHPRTAADPERLGWMIAVWRLATTECWLRDQEDSTFVDRLREEPLPQPRWHVHKSDTSRG